MATSDERVRILGAAGEIIGHTSIMIDHLKHFHRDIATLKEEPVDEPALNDAVDRLEAIAAEAKTAARKMKRLRDLALETRP